MRASPSHCFKVKNSATTELLCILLQDGWNWPDKAEEMERSHESQASGSLEKNPLIYHVDGYSGLRCVVSIEDSDECERSLQTGRTGMSSGEPSVTEAGAEVVMGKKE